MHIECICMYSECMYVERERYVYTHTHRGSKWYRYIIFIIYLHCPLDG